MYMCTHVLPLIPYGLFPIHVTPKFYIKKTKKQKQQQQQEANKQNQPKKI